MFRLAGYFPCALIVLGHEPLDILTPGLVFFCWSLASGRRFLLTSGCLFKILVSFMSVCSAKLN